ncbi:MAG: TRAP transporter small permease [Betaproteobacteria bacterium]|nr:TRAP transporter small permease [Betaproteobacteria bacterium]
MKTLHAMARISAVLAGAVLVAITGLTVVSIAGRTFFETAIVGDFELASFAAGAAVALFMPYAQARRAHIIVDFFTTKTSPKTRYRLDRFGEFTLGLVMLMLTWRITLGGLNAFASGAGSIMLGFPEWIVYALMAPAMALSAVIGLAQAALGWHEPTQAGTDEAESAGGGPMA